MRSKCFVAFLAGLAFIAGRTASSLADDLVFSDFDVHLTSHEQSSPADSAVVRTAFLSDSEVQPASHRVLHRGLVGGRGDECPDCALGEAWRYGPSSDCGAACDCGSTMGGCASFGSGSSCGCESCRSGSSCGSQTICDSNDELAGCCDTSDVGRCLFYSEVQIMWLRAHLMEDSISKLSEQYKFSPRLVVGFEESTGIGARLRYWHYDHTTDTLDNDDSVHFRFDVVDAELTSRFAMRKADLVVSGGARWAGIEGGVDGRSTSSDMIGLTVAADFRTQICGSCNKQWAGVAGGRWSIMGGDWEGSRNGFIPPVHDDNLIVEEIYAGVEYTCHTQSGHDYYARLTFELQNWRSDAAAQLSGAESLGFVGPGIHVGASF